MVLDEAEARLFHPGPHAVKARQLLDGREHNALMGDTLDLVEQCFALAAVEFPVFRIPK